MSKGKLTTPPIPKFRQLMDENEVKRDDIATVLGVSTVAIGQYYNGDTLPSIDNLIKIADYFNVSTDYLLGRTEQKTTEPTIRGICEYTGLSEKAVKFLNDYWFKIVLPSNSTELIFFTDFINDIINPIFMKDIYESFLCYWHIKERVNKMSHKSIQDQVEDYRNYDNINMFIDLETVYSDFVRAEIKEKTKQDINILFCGEDALYGIKSKIYEKFMLHLDAIIHKFKRGENIG